MKRALQLLFRTICYTISVPFFIVYAITTLWFYLIYLTHMLGWSDWSNKDIDSKMYTFMWANKFITLRANPDYIIELSKRK